VLSLDVLRAVSKSSGGVLKSFLADVDLRLRPIHQNPSLLESAHRVQNAALAIISFAGEHGSRMELAARQFAYSLARTYMGMIRLLYLHSSFNIKNR